jgi:hypothetical protein
MSSETSKWLAFFEQKVLRKKIGEKEDNIIMK